MNLDVGMDKLRTYKLIKRKFALEKYLEVLPGRKHRLKLAFYLDDHYLLSKDSQFVELVQADLDHFQQTYQPDLYHRLLIHKIVEGYSQLHSFSVGEGERRQTVVCWKQSLLSPKLEQSDMSAARPPSSRGRGRGRLRDQHSQSPVARSDDEGLQKISERDGLRGQTNVQNRTDEKIERKERPERKTRRPDVQVYVPRGKRFQEQQNNSSGTIGTSSADKTAGERQNNESRGHRYSSSPQHMNKSRAEGPIKVAAAAHSSMLKKEKDSLQYDNKSRAVQKRDGTAIGRENVREFTNTQEMNNTTHQPVTKVEGMVKLEKTTDMYGTSNTHMSFSGTEDKNKSLADENQSNCHDIETHSAGSLDCDDKTVPNASKTEQEEIENNISKHSEMVQNWNSDGEWPEVINFNTSDDSESSKKKMKVSDNSDPNLNYLTNEFTNLSDDAKVRQIIDIETKSENPSSELKSKPFVTCEAILENNSTDQTTVCEPEIVTKKELINADNNTVYSDNITFPKIAELENHSNFNSQTKLLVCDGKKQGVINSDDQVCKCESNLDERNILEYHNSDVEENITYQSTLRSQEDENETDFQLETNENLCDNLKISQNSKCCDNMVGKSDSHLSSDSHMENSVEDNMNMDVIDNRDEIGSDVSLRDVKKGMNVEIQVQEVSDKSSDCKVLEVEADAFTVDTVDCSHAADVSVSTHIACKELLESAEDPLIQTDNDRLDIDTIKEIVDTLKPSEGESDQTYNTEHVHEDGLGTSGYDKTVCKSDKIIDGSYDREDKIPCDPILKQGIAGSGQSGDMQQQVNQPEAKGQTDQSDDRHQSEEEQPDEDSWDAMFDDDGECLDPAAMEELTKTVGKVKIQKSEKINYLDYKPKNKAADLDYENYNHIIEIYNFPAEFVTRDLIMAFQPFMSRGFDLKWVDDTHALGVFSSAIAAQDALNMVHPLLKVCPLSQASPQAKAKARRCTEFLQPYKPRPETSAFAARRLVAGALGIQSKVPKEQRDKERQQLKEAKAKKRQDLQNREDIWEGRLGKCAMDEEG